MSFGLMLKLAILTPLFMILAVYVELGGGLGWLNIALFLAAYWLMRGSWKQLTKREDWEEKQRELDRLDALSQLPESGRTRNAVA